MDLEDQLGDTSAMGVLGVRIDAPPEANRVDVEAAEIEGLNETLRSELAARTIRELGVSVVVQGADLHLGENEAGSRWNESSEAGKRWLANRAAGEKIPDEDWVALRPQDRIHLPAPWHSNPANTIGRPGTSRRALCRAASRCRSSPVRFGRALRERPAVPARPDP